MTNQHVTHQDEFNIFEKLKMGVTEQKLPRGWVQIFLDKKKVHEGPNLIVARGREFVAQKIFEFNTTEDGTSRLDYYNYKVSHFGVGSGGSTIIGNDVNLTGPKIGDNSLYQPISLMTGSGYLNDPSSYEDSVEDPLIHSYKNAVKPIVNDGGGIKLEPVAYDDSPDFYTKVKCTCVIPAGEPTQLAAGASVQISEAGLYIVNSALATTDVNKAHMFAHICFSPKWIEKESALTIYWYILC